MGIQRARALRKNMSWPEAKLWAALRALRSQGYHFRRQVLIGPYYADFACHGSRLVIEVDGDTHFTETTLRYDQARDARIAADGYKIVRVPNVEVMSNLDGVMEAVLLELSRRAM